MTAQRSLFDALPPFQRHSDTSRMAAIHMRPKQGTKRAMVLDLIESMGAWGCTDEEGMTFLRMSGNTYRPRRIELVNMNLVKDSGERRCTLSGEQAVVWIATARGVSLNAPAMVHGPAVANESTSFATQRTPAAEGSTPSAPALDERYASEQFTSTEGSF